MEDKPSVAWLVCLYVQFYARHPVGSIHCWGVARWPFGLLRYGRLLQIDPSASSPIGDELTESQVGGPTRSNAPTGGGPVSGLG